MYSKQAFPIKIQNLLNDAIWAIDSLAVFVYANNISGSHEVDLANIVTDDSFGIR